MAKKKETLDEPSDGTVAVNDAWTGMLAISLVALLVGCGFLAYDMMQYTERPPEVPKYASPSSLKKAADGAAPKADGAEPKADGAKKNVEPKKL